MRKTNTINESDRTVSDQCCNRSLSLVKLIALMFALGNVKSGVVYAEQEAMINTDQVYKLVVAAWKQLPRNIDVTLSNEFMPKKTSPDVLRSTVKKIYDATDKGAVNQDASVKTKEIESEVKRISEEQKSPRRLFQRIRIDQERYRLDQTVMTPGVEIKEGTPFEQTFVNSGNPRNGDFTHFDYDHVMKRANIRNNRSMWKTTEVDDLFGLPLVVQLLVRVSLGILPQDNSNQVIEPDHEKIAALVAGAHESMLATIVADKNTSRISLWLQKSPTHPLFIFIAVP